MSEKEVKTYCPDNRREWRRWLDENHQMQKSIWLVFYKASSSKKNLSWSDAVEEALCFGWIDSLKKTIDEEQYMQYFTKRNPKSIWSKINKDKVEQLIKSNVMSKAGFESIEIAKQNGSWTSLDAIEALQIPEDLEKAFSTHKKSKEYYDSLSRSLKKGLLYWVTSAKRKETRERRIAEFLENAKSGQLPKSLR